MENVTGTDWSYTRESHMKYLNSIRKDGTFEEWTKITNYAKDFLLPLLRKNYQDSYAEDINVTVCVDETENDEMFPGHSFWTDFMIKMESDADIDKVLNELSFLGIELQENAVYYNSMFDAFLITLYSIVV